MDPQHQNMLELNLGAKQKKSINRAGASTASEVASKSCDSQNCDKIDNADLDDELEDLAEIDGVLPDELAIDFGQTSNCSSRRSSLKDEDSLFPHKCKKKVRKNRCFETILFMFCKN